jgi:hypothetical protein
MTVPNSTHGEIRFRGQKVAKVVNISMETQRATLDTTGIGDMDDEFAYGKRTTSGSAVVRYRIDDQPTVDLMNRIFEDGEQPDDLEMVIHKGSGSKLSGPVLINSQGIGQSLGESVSVNISFVISGKPSRAF